MAAIFSFLKLRHNRNYIKWAESNIEPFGEIPFGEVSFFITEICFILKFLNSKVQNGCHILHFWSCDKTVIILNEQNFHIRNNLVKKQISISIFITEIC